MTAEPTAALSVRISGKTKRYLDAVAEKKGIGVGKVLDHMVAELEKVPDEVAYTRTIARMCFLNNFYLRTVMNRTGMSKVMEAQIETVRKHADAMFGPAMPLPLPGTPVDHGSLPNEFGAMYAAFGVLDPTYVPPPAPATPEAQTK